MSSQSSITDFVASLQLAQQKLYQFGGPILICIGSVSCILSLLVFFKKNLRKNPCFFYIIAFSIANLIQIYPVISFITLELGYKIILTAYNLHICRFSIFIALVADILSPFYLILASIDRILVTSSNARTRRRSTHHLAYICIISGTLFWIVFHSHILVFSNITQFAPNYFVCYFESGIYLIYLAYYSLIIKAILVPLLMMALGLWTIKNVRSLRRIIPVHILSISEITTKVDVHYAHSKDRQLIQILLIDISSYIIFSMVVTVYVMYSQITQYNIKTFEEIQIELFMRYLSTFFTYIPFCIGCYTNLLVSKTFRKEVKNILLCK